MRTAILLVAVAMAGQLAWSTPAEAQRAAAGPPDWPCVQRLIPELSWTSMWTGPSPEELDESWRSHDEISRIVRKATSRSTSESEAVNQVEDFARTVEGNHEHELTLLFAGLFDQISQERSRTIDAIMRYSRGQVRRLERVSEMVDQLEQARSADDADPERIERLEQEIFWERRVFEDRQASLRALCDQPYLLEERLSQLVNTIQAAM